MDNLDCFDECVVYLILHNMIVQHALHNNPGYPFSDHRLILTVRSIPKASGTEGGESGAPQYFDRIRCETCFI